MSEASPFGLPLRIEVPGLNPSDWEDEEEDED